VSAAHESGTQSGRNAEVWDGGRLVDYYGALQLREVEARLFRDHREALSQRTLELGCGTGRLTEPLSRMSRELVALDLSAEMVAQCRLRCPGARVEQGDLLDLSRFEAGRFDAVVAGFNVLDYLSDQERRAALAELARLLVPGGLLLFSSHNRHFHGRLAQAVRLVIGDPRAPLHGLARLPLRLRNRRRLRPLLRDEPGYAVRNDASHDFSLLNYFISRDAQEAQLAAIGFGLLACLDLRGQPVPPGARARRCPELSYAARLRTAQPTAARAT